MMLFFSSFILYLATLAPSITVGDSGEFCAASAILGVPHSPGYPLYCLLGKAMTIVIPWGSLAYRVNLLSALAAAAGVALLYRAAARSWGGNGGARERALSAVAVALFAVSPAYWRSALQAEVFALNTLFAALILFSLGRKNDVLAAFAFGIGMGNHHTLVFLFPLVAAGIAGNGALTWRRGASLALSFAAGFSVYAYLPLRAAKDPALNWGDPDNLRNFWRVITRADYGSLALTVGEKMERTWLTSFQQLARFTGALAHQYTVAGLAAGLWGWVVGIRSRHPFAKTLLAVWLLAGPGFLLLANTPFNPEADGILERFFILINLFWVFPLAWGLGSLFGKVPPGAVAAGAVALCAITAASRYSGVNWRNYYLAHDYGRNILKTLAPQSVFFMDGGDDTFYSMAYFTFARKERPDIELHDRGGLVFKNAYGPDFRSLGRDEKEKRRREVERTFAVLRPLYYSTFNKRVLPGAELRPDGVLYRTGGEAARGDSLAAYSLRSVYGAEYADYRSRALVPVYPYFAGLHDRENGTGYWDYAYRRWPDALWLATNLKAELAERAFEEFSRGDLAAAERIYRRLLALSPGDAPSLINLGVIEERRGNLETAAGLYRQAIEAVPDAADAYYNLAVIHWRKNEWMEVSRYLRRLLAVRPDDARAKHYLPLAEERRARMERKK